jgi:hypothetical protein
MFLFFLSVTWIRAGYRLRNVRPITAARPQEIRSTVEGSGAELIEAVAEVAGKSKFSESE